MKLENLLPQLIKDRFFHDISIEEAITKKYVEQYLYNQKNVALPLSVFKIKPLNALKVGEQVHLQSIPTEILDTEKLWYLWIENWATEALSPIIFEMERLRALRVESYRMEQLPENLGAAANLEILILSVSTLVRLPDSLGDLSKLETLIIDSDDLLELPASIGQLKSLKQLILHAPSLKTLPDELCALENLEFLYLSHLPIKTLPANLGKLNKLHEFEIQHCALESFPESVETLNQLKYLYVNHTAIKAFPKSFGKMKALYHLQMRHCQLKELPDCIFDLPQLYKLDVAHNALKTLPNSINRLKDWISLRLGNNQITHFPDTASEVKIMDLFLYNNPIQYVPEPVVAGKSLHHVSFLESESAFISSEYKELTEYINKFDSKFDPKYKIPFYHIWLKKEDEIRLLDLSILLNATHYPLPRIEMNALYSLAHYSKKALTQQPFKKGDELVILGKVALKKPEIKKHLKELGIGYSSKITANTTHILLGDKIKEDLCAFENAPYYFLVEQQLVEILNDKNKPYLLGKDTDSLSNIQKIINLIESTNSDNISLALELIQGGGVPQELLTELFAITKLADESKLRNKAKKMLSKIASTELLAALKVRCDFRNNCDFESDFRRRLKLFEGTELDCPRMAMYFYLFKQRKAGGVGLIFNKGSDELIHYFIQQHLMVQDEIIIDRYNDGIQGFPFQLFDYPNLRKLTIKLQVGEYQYYPCEKVFPKELLNLKNLEYLEIKTSGYVLEHIPDCLAKHTSLKKLVWYQRTSQIEKDLIKLRPDITVISD